MRLIVLAVINNKSIKSFVWYGLEYVYNVMNILLSLLQTQTYHILAAPSTELLTFIFQGNKEILQQVNVTIKLKI